MVNVKELVASRLVEAATAVRGKVLDVLVAEEQEKRVKAVLKVIRDLDTARRDSHKIKPDVVTYDREGKILTEAFTKAKTEELKKNQDIITKLETALNEALDDASPNFDKVLKLGGGEKGTQEEKTAE